MARNQKQQREASEFEERVVYINRVSKTVKGGRRMSLVALVVVGDGKGNVGVGMGKSAEVPLAIQKGVEDAKKNMFHVEVTGEGTIPHEVEGHFGAGRVLIKPAVPGTGVIAGGPVRPLFELAGITSSCPSPWARTTLSTASRLLPRASRLSPRPPRPLSAVA